jgi:hypothetical protein
METIIFTPTQELIYEMLMTNTGKHFLDSGGGEGRNWQRNQRKTIEDFNNEPEEKFSFDAKYKEIYREVSVFHYLSELEIDSICETFNDINSNSDNWDSDFYGVSWEAESYLNTFEIENFRSWNTYNGDSDLSQVLQGATMEIEGEFYFLIQIHGGADVRGGYTDAYLFKSSDFNDGLIHQYLWEYKDSAQLMEEIEEEYHETLLDYWDESKTYTAKEVLNTLNS